MTTEIVITIICTVLTAICSYVICRKKCANNIEAQFGEFTSVYPPKVCYVLPCIIMVLELTASIFIFEFNQDVNIWICLTIFSYSLPFLVAGMSASYNRETLFMLLIRGMV